MEKPSLEVSEGPHIDPEREVHLQRLEEYLAVERLKIIAEFEKLQEGKGEDDKVHLAADLSIEPPKNKYLPKDEAHANNALESMYGTSDDAQIAVQQRAKEGFQFELLKSAIMHKYAGDRFITVRSSSYDDVSNHVDNVIVDRLTGEPLCAMDEVATAKITGNDRFDDKVDKVARANLGLPSKDPTGKTSREKEQARFGPGARLKYGIRIRDGKLECDTMNNLPLFLLSVDQHHLAEGLKNFAAEGGDEYTENLYRYFISAMNMQIEGMSLYKEEYSALPVQMKQRILFFKMFLDEEMKKKPGQKRADFSSGKVSY